MIKPKSVFQDYMDRVRPHLNEIHTRWTSTLFNSIPLNENEAILTAVAGGKRIRGSLLCLITESLGGRLSAALPRALAIELIHDASLIHDDFVDQDRTRRNFPAVWTLEGARRAVLLGDTIFASAIRMMNDLSVRDGYIVSHAIAELSKGALHEGMDPAEMIQGTQCSEGDGGVYEALIRLKTGVLFKAACCLGALAGEGDVRIQDLYGRFGMRIGEAYQMVDDLHEIQMHCRTGLVEREQAALLVPVLLRFSKDHISGVLPLLEQESSQLDGAALACFQKAATAITAEVRNRINWAVAEIAPVLPDNGYRSLLMSAPGDLIDMFRAI